MRFPTAFVSLVLLALGALATRADEPSAADPFRVLVTPTGCAVVFDGVTDEYRLDTLVDGGVTVGLYSTKLNAQEKQLNGDCLTRYRVSPSYDGQGSTIELRPNGTEFSSVIRAGQSLKIAFEKVTDLSGPAGVTDRSYKIGIGDQLQITVYAQEDLTKKATVGADGTIDYPLLGRVKAAGRSVRELQDGLTDALGKDYIVNPQVSIELATYKSQFAFVTGSVKTPSKVPLEGGTTLKDALSAGGGFSLEAGYVITVARRAFGPDGLPREPEKFTFSRADIEAGLANLDLRPDDVITVSEKDYFYIQGEVRKPGKYEVGPGLTLLRAIAIAEGLTDWANKKDVSLTRSVGSGARQLLNLKEIERQKSPDVQIAAGDIIIVPRRFL